ncbi:MAG: DsbA family protein [Alphaproteobacteria bacterium]
MTSLPLTPAHADESSNFTAPQKDELQEMFSDFINENPELIMESVRKFQEDLAQRAAQSAQENVKTYQEYFASDDVPIAGNPEGDVTVVEFFDYNCGYCRKAFEDIMEILEEDKNIRVVFMEYPILSPTSQKMAEYALAAKQQDKYFEMHQALMEYRGAQNDAAYMKLAKNIGLDTEQLKKDMEGAEVSAAIAKVRMVAQSLDIRGTPGFVIGDDIYPGAIGVKAMRSAIESARSDAARGE